MKLALLSNVTTDLLAKMLDAEHTLWCAPGYGAWVETALNVPNDLRAFNPDAVVLLLDTSSASVDFAPERARAALEAALPQTTVIVPDLEDLARETGDTFYDARMWQLASMPWSLVGLEAIAAEINRLLAFLRGGAKKVLALDLDGLLWRGVIGEDGSDGIVPNGALQQDVKNLAARGIVLVALSKNNVEDVAPVWKDPRMVLRREDFAVLKIDWQPKSANLAQVAKVLNLPLDAFVFLDDNPAERAAMRVALPDVVVPEDPFNLRRVTRLYFPEMRTSDEDRAKTALYQAEVARQDMRERADDFDAYLKDLGIWVRTQVMTADQMQRVAQLSQKTNQFNVDPHRYTPEDVARFAADEQRIIFTATAGDRFGEQGLIAFVQVVLRADKAEIIDWVMSCRAMNRRIEHAIQIDVEKALVARGIRHLAAHWRKTPKNAPVENLFEEFGFMCCETNAAGKTYMRVSVLTP